MGLHETAASSSEALLPEGHEGVFYRLLGWDVLKGKDGTLERWNAGNYSTVHLATLPQEWVDIYFGSGQTNSTDYEMGELHDDALSDFLKVAAIYDSREAWDRAQPLVKLPLKGVSAFFDQIAVLRYAKEGNGVDRSVATFKGRVIRSLRAETDGYLVEVIEKFALDQINEFAAKVKKSLAETQSSSENEIP